MVDMQVIGRTGSIGGKRFVAPLVTLGLVATACASAGSSPPATAAVSSTLAGGTGAPLLNTSGTAASGPKSGGTSALAPAGSAPPSIALPVARATAAPAFGTKSIPVTTAEAA